VRALNSDAKTIINRGEVLIMGQEITQYRKYQEAKMGKMPDDVTREEMEEHVCEWYAYGREGSMSPVRDAEVLDAILRTIRKSRIVDSDAAPQAAPPEGAEDGDEFRRLAGEIFTGVFNEGMCEFDIADKIKALLQKQGPCVTSNPPSVSREWVETILSMGYEYEHAWDKDGEGIFTDVVEILNEAGVEVKDA